MKVLSTVSSVQGAVRAFRKRLEEVATSSAQMEWGFPNGERAVYLTYTLDTRSGQIQVGLPSSWGTRIPHLIRSVKDQGPPSPDVEINIPPELDRKIAGAYAQSGAETWLCHRGDFTSFRGRISKEKSLAHFTKWLQEVDDSGKATVMIPVVAISSATFADDLGAFVVAVAKLKELHKQNPVAEPSDFSGNNADWSKGREYEGIKSAEQSQKSISYEYLHGPICNRLEDQLNACTVNGRLKFGRNDHVDAALVDPMNVAAFLFEVKTAALPSNQIYSAVGQLYYYRHLYGCSSSRMFVVLPELCRSSQTEQFLAELGMGVLYECSDGFIDSSGKALEDIVRGEKAI
jgi:hypothetical protein